MGGSLVSKTGYQGSQNIVTPGVAGTNLDPTVPKPGNPTALAAANFSDPAVYSVSFNVTTPVVLPTPTPSQGAPPPLTGPGAIVPPLGVAAGVRCVATINFKVEGVQVQRIVDVGSGVTVTGVAQAIDINLQDLTYTVGGPAGVQYAVSAAITKGTRASTSLPPTLWQPPAPSTPLPPQLAPGDSIIIAIPQNAGVVSVEVSLFDITDSDAEPVFVGVTNFTNGTVNKFYSPVVEPAFVRVTPGSTSIRIGNNSATDTVQYSVTWGIDG